MQVAIISLVILAIAAFFIRRNINSRTKRETSIIASTIWVGLALMAGSTHADMGDMSGSQYGGNDARRIQQVQVGVVEDIRVVQINVAPSTNTGYVGTGLGAVIGAAAGQTMGNGNGRNLATAVMGALGGVVGNQVANRASAETKRAVEIIVTLRNGQTLAITQELDAEAATLRAGDTVRVLQGSNARVAKLRSGGAQTAPTAYQQVLYR